MMKTNGQAYTLIELLLALALLALLAVLSLPAIGRHYHKVQLYTHVQHFIAAIDWARMQAVQRGQRLTLCASNDAKHCQTDWCGGQIIGFVADGQFSVLKVLPLLAANERLTFHGFSDDDRLDFGADGWLIQNGTFTWCLAEQPCAHIVLNRAGRVRVDYT